MIWSIPVIAGEVFASCVGCVLGLVALSLLRRAGHVRRNYRGRNVAYPSGVILPVALSAGLFAVVDLPRGAHQDPVLFAGVAWGFAFLGLADDLFGDRTALGLGGHLAALRHGRLTTGILKAAGGLALGFWVAWRIGPVSARMVVTAVLVALAANFFNLLDLRPGRTLKVFSVTAVVLYVFSHAAPSWTAWPALIPATILLLALDLNEYAMLGDTGANVLGAMIGLAFVLNFGWQVQLAAAILLAAATVASEKCSFSKAIDSTPVLRWMDGLGRRSQADIMGDKREG